MCRTKRTPAAAAAGGKRSGAGLQLPRGNGAAQRTAAAIAARNVFLTAFPLPATGRKWLIQSGYFAGLAAINWHVPVVNPG